MADDFYTFAANQRLAQIDATKSRALADLAEQKAASDYEGAAASVQSIANAEAERANLIALHKSYVVSLTPPVPPAMSREERDAKPWQKMDWNDALEIARTSKYAKDLNHDDPNVAAGYREAMARRGRGD
jgi:hypothetical protein